MILKKVYLKKVPTKIKIKKSYNKALEKCDLDLAKLLNKFTTKSKKPIIWRNFIEKDTFDCSLRQEVFFQAIKVAITNNGITGTNPNLQFHFLVDIL